MNNVVLFSLIYIFGVFLSSCSQILLKKSANKTYKNKAREYINPLVIVGYSVFFICTLISMYCLKVIALSRGQLFESLGYIFVSILGFFILKEKLKKNQIIGMGLIVIGTIIFVI